MPSGWPKCSPAFPGKTLLLQLFCSASCWHCAHVMPEDGTAAWKEGNAEGHCANQKVSAPCEPRVPFWLQNHLSQGALGSLQASSRTASCGNHRVCTSLCAGSKEGRYKCKWGCLLWQRRLTAPNVWLVQVIISTFLCISKCRIVIIRTNEWQWGLLLIIYIIHF